MSAEIVHHCLCSSPNFFHLSNEVQNLTGTTRQNFSETPFAVKSRQNGRNFLTHMVGRPVNRRTRCFTELPKVNPSELFKKMLSKKAEMNIAWNFIFIEGLLRIIKIRRFLKYTTYHNLIHQCFNGCRW